uniref:Uncharacterized protein n=1 Tax=Zea mays TaxID=4577 RepID=A0A804U600_MAIZE
MPYDYIWSPNHPAAASDIDWQRGAARRRPSGILDEGEAGGLPQRGGATTPSALTPSGTSHSLTKLMNLHLMGCLSFSKGLQLLQE